MWGHALSSHDLTRRCRRRHYRNAATLVCLSLIAAPGCGLDDAASRSGASVEIIQGSDSAGAIIELEKRGVDLARARVTDLVLGTGEAEIISGNDGYVEFTIHFPVGVAITYRGQQTYADTGLTASGTWHQHPGGVFGGDSGTWQAPSSLDNRP